MFGTYLSKRSIKWSLALVGIAALAGCPDPQGRFDEFVERSPVGGGGSDDGGGSEIADLDGRFLLAASVTLNRSRPLLFDAEVTMSDACPGEGCTIDMVVQPLANELSPKADCPAHLEDVGDVIELRDVPVEADGSFRAIFSREAVGTVDGCANPISGSEIEATLELVASTRSDDVFCGPLEGSLFRPFTYDLGGSTFGAIRIEDAPAEAGVEPILDCPPEDGEGGAGGGGGADGAGGAGGAGGGGGGGGA